MPGEKVFSVVGVSAAEVEGGGANEHHCERKPEAAVMRLTGNSRFGTEKGPSRRVSV